MLSFVDKILIKNLLEYKWFSARRLLREFPKKDWKRRTIDDFLRNIKYTDSSCQNVLFCVLKFSQVV